MLASSLDVPYVIIPHRETADPPDGTRIEQCVRWVLNRDWSDADKLKTIELIVGK